MASNYSRFSKGIDNVFKDIHRDNKIKKVVEARDSIQAMVKKSFKVTMDDIKFGLKSSGCSKELYEHLNTVDSNLYVLVDNVMEYTDDFVRYIKKENNPTVFSLVVLALFIFFVIGCFFWFVFNSASLFGFFVNFMSTTLIAFALGGLIDYFGRIWLLVDSVNRSERKSLEALSIIQENSNLIIEKLESSSVNTTTTLAENLQNLLVTTEELFKI